MNLPQNLRNEIVQINQIRTKYLEKKRNGHFRYFGMNLYIPTSTQTVMKRNFLTGLLLQGGTMTYLINLACLVSSVLFGVKQGVSVATRLITYY